MNVWVRTVDGELRTWEHIEVTFDSDVLQVTGIGSCVTTFPLCNVIAFSTDEDQSYDEDPS